MKQFGLIGKKLAHSFSKNYFTEKFKQQQLNNYTYQNFEIANINEFPTLLKNNPDLIGLNVTIPYKETIIPFLDDIDETAQKIGAINTIKINKKTGKTKGFNTDYYGFKQSIKPFLESQHQRALILGTGGASKAVKYVLDELGISTVYVSRNPTNENQLAYNEIDKNILQTHLLIINTTPLGMFPNETEKPPLEYQYLTPQHLLVDLIYNPTETLFLKEGKKQNTQLLNGLSMLKLQAEKAWDIWNSN